MTAIASAPARICLVGEDLDWVQCSSILCAIDLRATVEISFSDTPFFYITSKLIGLDLTLTYDDLFQCDTEEASCIIGSIIYVYQYLKLVEPLKTLRIVVKSEIPYCAGLSSSAAIILATLKALFSLLELSIPINEICKHAFFVESIVLKRNVGQMDLYSCGLGGINYINCSCEPPSILKLDCPQIKKLLIIDTLEKRITKDVIAWKKERYEKCEPDIMNYIHETTTKVSEMLDIIKSNKNLECIGRKINECNNLLETKMRVSTPTICKCIQICLSEGAYGAKITGTGKGGCLFVLADIKAIHRIVSKLKELPVKTYITLISSEGVN